MRCFCPSASVNFIRFISNIYLIFLRPLLSPGIAGGVCCIWCKVVIPVFILNGIDTEFAKVGRYLCHRRNNLERY